VALLQRKLPALCATPRARQRDRGAWAARARRETRAHGGSSVAAEGSAPPQRRMLRSLRSELVMASAFDIAEPRREGLGQDFCQLGNQAKIFCLRA
jgi:hypothetical protein